MAFSETELVFLASIFIFRLSLFLLGRENNTSTAKNTKKKGKGQTTVTRRHSQDHQQGSRQGPDENDGE